MADRRKCTWPEEECDGKVICCVRDSSAPGGFEWLCARHWAAWSPPTKDLPEFRPYERKRRRRKTT